MFKITSVDLHEILLTTEKNIHDFTMLQVNVPEGGPKHSSFVNFKAKLSVIRTSENFKSIRVNYGEKASLVHKFFRTNFIRTLGLRFAQKLRTILGQSQSHYLIRQDLVFYCTSKHRESLELMSTQRRH